MTRYKRLSYRKNEHRIQQIDFLNKSPKNRLNSGIKKITSFFGRFLLLKIGKDSTNHVDSGDTKITGIHF